MLIDSKDLLINLDRTPDIKSNEYKGFWINERDKCINGTIIDGTTISGFLYYHLNFFKCQLDVLDNGRVIRKLHNPYLRDNEWLIDSYITRGEKEKKGVGIVGSRRLGKSVIESSYITHGATFFKGTQNVIAGLNTDDIKTITDLSDVALSGLPDAFKKGRIEDNWKKAVTLGKKFRSGERDAYSYILIRNLNGGENTEALAGMSPFRLILDEIGKGDFLDCLSAAIPGFSTPYGWRCSPLLFGTSGDMSRAGDAKKLFENPETYNFITVELPEEDFRRTSVFISGHYAHDFPKDDIKLNEYLKIKEEDAPNLAKIDIQVTNFELAEEMIGIEREQASKSNDSSNLLKLTMYHPKNTFEVFLSDSNNNFPIETLKAHQHQLYSRYEPMCVDLYRNVENKVQYRESYKKPIDKFPVGPKDNKDAPVVIYEFPIDGLPFGTYVVGIDPYNENESSDRVNSLGSAYVFKRMYTPLGEYQNSIVASYAGRCKEVKEFHKLILDLVEYYNAVALPENEDKTLIQYFFHKNKGHLLIDSLQLARQINPNTQSKRDKGLSASIKHQQYYMDALVLYSKEEIVIVNEDGGESIKLGCFRIPDPMLLEEMIHYKSKPSSSRGIHAGNFDRVISMGHALTCAIYLDLTSPLTNFNIKDINRSNQEVRHKSFVSPFVGIQKAPLKINNPFIQEVRKPLHKSPFTGIK